MSNNPKTDLNNEKRKLIYWISQWTPESNSTQETDIDISDLTIFFQIIGFKLEQFEKNPDVQENAVATPSDCESITAKVQLMCSKSGMRSRLTKAVKVCQCPSSQDMEKGQLWSVTGCEPSSSSQSTVSSSACSLIPTISKCKVHVAGHLIHKTFSIIKDNDKQENEVSGNLSQNALLTRHRSLDTLKSREGSNLVSENIMREMSWEVDPKTSPPTKTSSPIPDLTHTLSRISLDSDSKSALIRKLSTIQELTKEALELTGVNSASTKKIQRKRVSDIKPEDVAVNGWRQKTPNTPRKKVTPTRRLISSGPNKCGIPTPASQKTTCRTETEKNLVGVKPNLNNVARLRSGLGLSSMNKPSTSVGIPKYRKSFIPKK